MSTDRYGIGERAESIHGCLIQQVPSIEKKGRAMHGGVNFFKVDCLEFVPFGQHRYRMGIIGSLVTVFCNADIVFDQPSIFLCQVSTHLSAR